MATGKLPKGFFLEIENSLGSGFGPGLSTRLAGLTSFSKPTIKVPDVDVTDLDDDATTTIPGLPDFGNMDYDINWMPNSPSDIFIEAMLAGFEVRGARLNYPGGVTDTINVYVSSYDASASGPNQAMKGKVSFRCTGSKTRAP
ncbi:MAG TPA: phage tail tube protein [Phenylobacterium sp.]|nr:phage tail tube protein [Phenylobacterium sp.]